jgi:uncharacterized membrane protein YvbJ
MVPQNIGPGKFCRLCGSNTTSDSVYCRTCGTKLD